MINDVNSSFIEETSRQRIVHILKEVSQSRRRFGLSARLPNYYRDTDGWPKDLKEYRDLSSSVTDVSLRDDVGAFIVNIFEEVIPKQRYCALHYRGAVQKPLLIEVTTDYFERVTQRIKEESESLRTQFGYDNYLPEDIIEIIEIPVRGPLTPDEEGSHTLGTS